MTQIKLRRDTSAAFASSNPILGNGEPAYETDTKKLKIGDGTTAYTQLEYFSAGGGGGSSDISAALPLKIVDGVISLEVDGQTIQIVDGKLHASNNIFDIGKFTVVGNPTITDDGIASGFSSRNYLTKRLTFTPNQNLIYRCKFTTGNDITTNQYIFRLYNNLTGKYETNACSIHQENIRVILRDGVIKAYPCQPNTTYYVAMEFNNVKSEAKIYSVNNELLSTLSYTESPVLMKASNSLFTIGILTNNGTSYINPYTGSIYLPHFSITVDGKEVFSGLMNSTKPIYDAIKASNTELSEFKTETSNDFSAVDSALNEKANLSDLALKQNKLTAGDNITISADNVISATGGSAPANMVTTDTAQTISGDKTLTGVTSISNNMRIAIGTKITTPSGQWLMQFNTGSIGIGTSMFPLQTFDGGDYYLRTRTVTAGNGIKVDDMGDGFIKISSAIENMAAYVTEEFIDGTEGYRIWSNGRCEQWGYKSGTNEETITFLKAFEDTNYNVVMATEGSSRFFQGGYSNKTTTDMLISYTGDSGGSALGTSWMVTGNISKGGDAGAK